MNEVKLTLFYSINIKFTLAEMSINVDVFSHSTGVNYILIDQRIDSAVYNVVLFPTKREIHAFTYM